MKQVSSGLLAKVLRHNPEILGLSLSTGSWAEIEDLCRRLRKYGRQANSEILNDIARKDDKQRFTISDDGLSIRAAQGHSFGADLELTAKEPPQILLHGTSRDRLDDIWAGGLLPKGRDYVHLSLDKKTAEQVGSRHGKVVVLEVSALEMHADGFAFYLADNGVWLTSKVPTKYLGFAP